MAAGALASALYAGGAFAQDAEVLSAEIQKRIETTFALVLGNSEDLAIPLTRRALARRFSEDDQSPAVVPALAYGELESAPSTTFDPAPAADDPPAATASIPVVEEGSAEDPEDPDIARLPRPRPAEQSEQATEEAMGGPLDLVASAADEGTEDQIAAADPQPARPAGAPAALAPTGSAALAPAAAGRAQPSDAPLELVASGECLSPADVTDKDGDFKRNAEVLSGSTFCIAEEKFKERRRNWRIVTIKTSRPGPLFAVMHDDEDMSFDNAVEALKTYGGTLVAVETGGKRNQDGIDPNRNFSAGGVGCKKLGGDATPKYTEFFRQLFDPGQPIIALHNNTGKRIPTGGLGHVSMGDVPKDMETHESSIPDGPLAGERALVLLTSPIPISTTSNAVAATLSAKGINAVIEGVREGKGDCSLSNYTLLTGHPDYLNVTVDDDERDKQRQIIDAIMAARPATVATQ